MHYRAVAATTLLVVSGILVSVPCAAQDPLADEQQVYERETFSYDKAGRVDPFRSLLNDAEMGFRFEDLSLLGVVHHPDPGRSVAILARQGREQRIQARVGERYGSLRIAAIHPDRVELIIEELGVARRETLHLQKKQPEEAIR